MCLNIMTGISSIFGVEILVVRSAQSNSAYTFLLFPFLRENIGFGVFLGIFDVGKFVVSVVMESYSTTTEFLKGLEVI